jgi:hypothetical protein
MVGLIIIGIISVVAGVLAFLWADGIDYMSKNHPDYKGEDFLDWDDNKTNSEGMF